MAKKDYANIRDEEAQRTRAELWIIIAIVVVVLVGGLVFRMVKHERHKPPADVNISVDAPAPVNTPAAAAGVSGPHPPPATPRGP